MEYYHFKVLQSIVISSNIYSNLLNKISIKILFTTKSCNLTINVFKWVQITYFFGGSYLEEIRDALKNEALTKTSKKIAQFVLDNVAEACFMTSTDIALKLSVSESSVIRFSRSLGFSGFMDFQKSLRKSYQTRVSSLSGSIAVPYERLVKSFEMSDNINYADEYFLNTTKNIQSVLINNDRKKFDSASKIIDYKSSFDELEAKLSEQASVSLLYLQERTPEWEVIFSCFLNTWFPMYIQQINLL